MKIVDIRKKLPFKKSNGKMNLNKIDTVVIHHDAVPMTANYDDMKRLIGEANLHISKGYGHISYHYSINNVGTIFYCLSEDEIAYHCGSLVVNRNSIAVKFDGNFQTQKPTKQQVQAYNELMIWLTTKRPDLPKVIRRSIKGHYQIKPTACPGTNIKPLISKF